MGAAHDHAAHDHAGHAHGIGANRGTALRRLAAVLALVLLYMGAEVVGGILTGSLALIADAGHMLSDAGALGLALFAMWMARKPRSAQRTFGYHRTEILAALANGLTLVAVAIWIVVEAFHRLEAPPQVDGKVMLWIAVGGLVVNGISLLVLHGGREASLNLRGAWLHVATDALGSLQAIVAGFLVWQLGWDWADPVASILIALLVVASSWSLTREAVHVLMEGTPRHIDSAAVRAAITAIPGVVEVHDLHVWTITSGFESLSVHARVDDRDRDAILADIRRLLADRFHLEHSTVQLEHVGSPTSACGEGCCD